MPEEYKKLMDYGNESVSEEEYGALRTKLLKEFKETQIQLELQIFCDRQQWVQEDELSAWFLASRERLALFHRFNLQGFPDGHTVSMESKALGIDRSQMSRMLSEAHGLGFIYRNKEPKKQRFFLPSQHLLDNGTWYAEYYVSQILSTEKIRARGAFIDLKRAESAARQNMRGNHVDFFDPVFDSRESQG